MWAYGSACGPACGPLWDIRYRPKTTVTPRLLLRRRRPDWRASNYSSGTEHRTYCTIGYADPRCDRRNLAACLVPAPDFAPH